MNGSIATDVLGAMITPAVLISASGTLVLSTSNRLSRVVDRVRKLAAEAGEIGTVIPEERRRLIVEQLSILSSRALLLRSALTSFYLAIGLLVATSIAVGIVAALRWQYGWIPVVTGLGGACALLWGSLLLVREARQAIGFTLHELAEIRRSVGE
ncbi:MAG TPA: DUF2721 domain-containing protein [Thermoanaerobaculia bacterium]|nr:DUF2721 domain-containing protein [Thermoanaerobaculia bacterium]